MSAAGKGGPTPIAAINLQPKLTELLHVYAETGGRSQITLSEPRQAVAALVDTDAANAGEIIDSLRSQPRWIAIVGVGNNGGHRLDASLPQQFSLGELTAALAAAVSAGEAPTSNRPVDSDRSEWGGREATKWDQGPPESQSRRKAPNWGSR